MNRPIEKPGALDLPGIAAGRLAPESCALNFTDAHPPLNPLQALLEAERCYYCYNAPCIEACPTGIDIPHFIQRIAQDNVLGAAETILDANVLGGMCARVCPTENLCEGSCVRQTNESKPVEIGLLQRFATDAYFAAPSKPIFTRAAPSGRRIAVVGAGPAGLSAAHRLAALGHDVVVFEAHSKPGGLNEYGLARYKTPDGFAQREIEWLLSIGGIEIQCGKQLGRDITLSGLVEQYDAVFLGMGLAGVNSLGIAEQQLVGLQAAVDFIAELRQAKDLSAVPVGRRVVVIGGGMTAVDAAVQAKKLGAREVTMVYRRGAEAMSASAYEQQWAQINGVTIRHWAAPREILGSDGFVTGAVFAVTRDENGKLVETGETFTLEADMVLKAIGQSFVAEPLDLSLALEKGRIATDPSGQTSHQKIWAGGDCRAGGLDLTVEAVEHGKQAAIAIDAALRA
ncbi:NAD(P)-dependent oxidoreductase [Uliginosibacterium aquaticum]|uniref:dihydrouracil dehydrogenase (NAD(+)) n=1 Tax=Uliginosibacterium aquaticum TaxID=2731212 RepID=A0ABX2IKR6_9RHOO|nr:NAD(P)-dependent oxidoreductase [Uliginosibacterium aquaticum]NSL55617.1 NAD(P)-dependent oxidoreductase [Uliginosibacterium aquaticum]